MYSISPLDQITNRKFSLKVTGNKITFKKIHELEDLYFLIDKYLTSQKENQCENLKANTLLSSDGKKFEFKRQYSPKKRNKNILTSSKKINWQPALPRCAEPPSVTKSASDNCFEIHSVVCSGFFQTDASDVSFDFEDLKIADYKITDAELGISASGFFGLDLANIGKTLEDLTQKELFPIRNRPPQTQTEDFYSDIETLQTNDSQPHEMESPLATIQEHNPSIIPESQSHSPIHPQPPPQPAINSHLPPYSPPNPFPSDDIEQALTQLALSRPEKSKKINQFYLNQHPTAIKKLETKFFHTNSKLRYIGQATGNKMHGFGKVLYENGNIKLAGKFNRDLPDGIMAFFSHHEEKLLFSGVCQNGFKKEGKLFYTNGVMLYCGSFMADQIAGEGCEIYWDNGNLKFSGDFRGGLPFNCGKFYDRNGELVWK